MKEAEFKSAFKKAVRSEGGFALSLAAPTLPGTPDLYCIMPGFMPVLLEAKWLGILNTKFKRKIQYSPMQAMYLDELTRINPNSAYGLIGFKYEGKLHTVMKARMYKEQNETIDSASFHLLPISTPKIEVAKLFGLAGIPRINGVHHVSAVQRHKREQPTDQDGHSEIPPQ